MKCQASQEDKTLQCISLARACRQQSMATLPLQALLAGSRCWFSSELSSGDAGSSPQPWGSRCCCGRGITPKSKGKPRYCGPAWASHDGEDPAAAGRDAGSIPGLHGKWAMPSPGAKLELALSWFKKSPETNLAILMGRGVGFSVTLPSAGATHAELVRQARPEVLMKL